MVDFLMVSTRSTKKGSVEIYPKFIVRKSTDLMIRGRDFYAVWLEDKKLWSTDEQDALQIIDKELDRYYEEHKEKFDVPVKVLHMWDAETRLISSWHQFCQKDMRDSYSTLDEKLIFSDMETTKEDYASKKLPYALSDGPAEAYDRLMSVLYSPEERAKLEWAIGSVVAGDSKKLQKFVVLYGGPGTGKSTVLNIIEQLFAGYCSVFDAKALGSSNNSFALEAFRSNPLVAIQHDGDLSKIEDNTRLNSLVSHETMTVNEKFKSTYESRFKSFLFMGTNKPVKITDSKSGLIRRLIDVTPTGEKLDPKEYRKLVKQIDFELGSIAYRCLEEYKENPNKYDNYIPAIMLGASNDFYNFVLDSYFIFKRDDGISLKSAWEMYRVYCEDAKVPYPYPQRIFKEELKSYFQNFYDRYSAEDGSRIRSYYEGFRFDRFEGEITEKKDVPDSGWLRFDCTKSLLDDILADCPAQYANSEGTPSYKWENVKTTLKDIDTTQTHYLLAPECYVVVDFDIPDESGQKCLSKNLEEANKWPETYAELSKSGQGIHLTYRYDGDPSKLARIFTEHVEIKVFSGKSSLRRKLTKCNDIPIATISSGLPVKEEKMVNFKEIENETHLRNIIKQHLRKEIFPNTKPSMDMIYKTVEEAYESGMVYDISDMENGIVAFALSSTNQAQYCMKLASKMHYKSESEFGNDISESPLVFYDIEVFPNLFLIKWKKQGKDNPVVEMINPSPEAVEEIFKFRLVGFNCRQYDNHLIYARGVLHYDNLQLYQLSQSIISNQKGVLFGAAYNLSYTDILDFSATKQSLKKFEIQLHIHHKELGLPWDQPVPENLWPKVSEYCTYDVLATEATFEALKGDFKARQILADLAGMTVNDTTNTLTTRIIFGKERHPALVYTDLATGISTDGTYSEANKFDGYSNTAGKNMYLGTDLGYGGYAHGNPGIYTNVALLDVASLHPHSAIAMNCFGEYTKNYNDILEARIAIKHKDYEKAKMMLGGKLAKYLDDESIADDLAQALKIAINSVYGLTSASFENPFRDIRNTNNIVALRGALFMRLLQKEVEDRGYTVVHIKTDSIKIANADKDIIDFCMEFAKKYKYTFEHEATYDRICLVNDAVYIAKYATVEKCEFLYGRDYVQSEKDICKKNKKHPGEWDATGTQFQVPYVFKTLFSKEDIQFEDLCETKEVKSALYLDFVKNRNPEDFVFVGKIGLFCPIKEGFGGGDLLRQGTNKKTGETTYGFATGTKGYSWKESENVSDPDIIDRSYYDCLVDDAVEAIKKYGDFEWFTSEDDDIPPWYPDEPTMFESTIFDVR